MALTVKQLIKELKKCRGDLIVGMASHDNEAHEIQGLVNCLDELDDGKMKEAYGPMVVLRS